MPVSTGLLMDVQNAVRIMCGLLGESVAICASRAGGSSNQSVKVRIHHPIVKSIVALGRMSGCLERYEDKGDQQEPDKAQHDFRNSHIFVTSPHSVGLGYFYSAPPRREPPAGDGIDL